HLRLNLSLRQNPQRFLSRARSFLSEDQGLFCDPRYNVLSSAVSVLLRRRSEDNEFILIKRDVSTAASLQHCAGKSHIGFMIHDHLHDAAAVRLEQLDLLFRILLSELRHNTREKVLGGYG